MRFRLKRRAISLSTGEAKSNSAHYMSWLKVEEMVFYKLVVSKVYFCRDLVLLSRTADERL